MPMAASEQAAAAAAPAQAQSAVPDQAVALAAGPPARESLAELLLQPLPYAGEAESKGKAGHPGGAGSGECDNPLVWTLLYLAQHYDRLGRTGAPFAHLGIRTQAERALVHTESESSEGSGRCGDAMGWSGCCLKLVQHTAGWYFSFQPSGTIHLSQLSLRCTFWEPMRSFARHDMSAS